MAVSTLVLITAALATLGEAAPRISTKISPCIPKSLCETSTTTTDTPLSFNPGGPISLITARDTPLTSINPGGPIIIETDTPLSFQPGGPIITARDTPLTSINPGGPIITARDTPLTSINPGGPIITARDTPLTSINPGGPIITARDTPLTSINPGGPNEPVTTTVTQPGGPIITARDTPLTSINPGGPIITVAPRAPEISTKISPCIPKEICETDTIEARDTPLTSINPGGPIITARAPEPITPPICDIASICIQKVNDCGIPYELCYVPECAGGPATPTPTGTVPPCPPTSTVSAAKRTASIQPCPVVPLCETLTNNCGTPYQYCYAPGCDGAPDQLLSNSSSTTCN